MKSSKLIGWMMVSAALLLQVGYASPYTMQTVATQALQVNFKGTPEVEYDEYMSANAYVDQDKVRVVTHNLYPGAKWQITAEIANTGQQAVEVTHVGIEPDSVKGDVKELYRSLEIYNEQFIQAYEGQILEPGESIDIRLEMGLSPGVANLENQSATFNLNVQFAQAEKGGSGGGGQKPDPIPDPTPGPDKELPDIEIPEEMIPGGPISEIELSEEVVPRGAVPEIELLDEVVPGGALTITTRLANEMLPQTGGLSPIVVYGIGIMLLGTGWILYKKEV